MGHLADLLGWLALAATCIAAMMTAANLGVRVTGYGFAIFFIGALAWIAVGAATGQRQLLWSNAFLAVVDLIGVWRWLHRRAQAEDATAAAKAKRERRGEALCTVDALMGAAVHGPAGALGTVEGMLVGCADGAIDHVIVRAAHDGSFRRLAWSRDFQWHGNTLETSISPADFARMPAA